MKNVIPFNNNPVFIFLLDGKCKLNRFQIMHKIIYMVSLLFFFTQCTPEQKKKQEVACTEDYRVINSVIYYLIKEEIIPEKREFGYTNHIWDLNEMPGGVKRKTFIVDSFIVDSTLNEIRVTKCTNGFIKISQNDLKKLKPVKLNTTKIRNVGYRRIYKTKYLDSTFHSMRDMSNEAISISRIIYNETKDKAFFTIEYSKHIMHGFVKDVFVVKKKGIWVIQNEITRSSWIE